MLNFSYAQSIHKDQMEYCFKGKVKVVIKKNYSNPVVINNEVIPGDSNYLTTYTYFFNENGNLDSSFTERTLSSGDIYFYKSIYQFDKLKKTGWTALNAGAEKLLSGKIIWQSDNEYTEKVYDANDNLKYETNFVLNDSFRIIKTTIKAFDNTGNLIQNDIQEFKIDKSQNIELYKTIHQQDGSSDITEYKNLNYDKLGNTTKLLISKKNRDAKTLVTIEYIYYR